MNIIQNAPLADYVTMKLGGPAKLMVTVESEQDLAEAVNLAREQNLKLMPLGSGSNIIFKDAGFDGLVILNKIMGLDIDETNCLVKANSGENWDNMVSECLKKNMCGIESMSYIPGTVGASPINNIGAYGQELKDTLLSVRAYDTKNNQFVEFGKDECDFGYRNSRFKSYDWGKYIISGITLRLAPTLENYQVPQYKSLTDKLAQAEISHATPSDVRRALNVIRNSKLPDPKKLPNTGSFFKNPIIQQLKARELLEKYPAMPTYPQTDGSIKLAAGWLIENAGLKNYRRDGIWVYEHQALVLVNESAKSFKNLESMYQYIVHKVNREYGIKLEPEPEIV